MDFTANQFNDFSDVLAVMDDERSGFRGSHFEIVSKTAYLLGVHKKFFESDKILLKLDIYNELEKDKRARIIRNLCHLRTQLEHNFLKVCNGIQHDGLSIMTMPEYMPPEAMKSLSDDGIDIYTNLTDPTPFMINLNSNIKARINNCRVLFPAWLKWEYLADIFIMPDGLTPQGTKRAAEFFYANIDFYPFKVYMNWPAKRDGNILYDDKKFVTRLYQWNNDEFTELNLVSDASDRTKDNIHTVIENSSKCVFVVDCENSDPYRLCAAIKGLDQNKASKITKIILYDDVHTTSAWEILEDYTHIPTEYIMIERVMESKSLTDIKVTARICQEHYSNGVDTFILASSDSDYWGLMEEMPNVNFLIMAEREKCGASFKDTLKQHDIPYCYIDSFYAGDASDLKKDALQREIDKTLSAALNLNINDIMQDALIKTRIRLTEEEIKSFINRRLKNQIDLIVTDEGDVKLEYRAIKH